MRNSKHFIYHLASMSEMSDVPEYCQVMEIKG